MSISELVSELPQNKCYPKCDWQKKGQRRQERGQIYFSNTTTLIMISETASDLAYRGHNRQVVFVSDEDYFYYQENLKEWKENLGISRTRETKEGKKINLSPFLFFLVFSSFFTSLCSWLRRSRFMSSTSPVAASKWISDRCRNVSVLPITIEFDRTLLLWAGSMRRTTLYVNYNNHHKMWGVVSMNAWQMYRGFHPLDKSLPLLVVVIALKKIFSTVIQTDLSCMLPISFTDFCILPRNIQGPDKSDRHSFPIEMM